MLDGQVRNLKYLVRFNCTTTTTTLKIAYFYRNQSKQIFFVSCYSKDNNYIQSVIKTHTDDIKILTNLRLTVNSNIT